MDRRRARLLLQKIRASCHLVTPAGGISAASDPDDNMFLDWAEAAKAHYLITGNTGHFPKRWKITSVISPRTFLGVWKDYRSTDDPGTDR